MKSTIFIHHDELLALLKKTIDRHSLYLHVEGVSFRHNYLISQPDVLVVVEYLGGGELSIPGCPYIFVQH